MYLNSKVNHFLSLVPSSPEPSFKSEIHSGLPAPPQMPLPEIPHPWLVRLTKPEELHLTQNQTNLAHINAVILPDCIVL